jgi:hypothetical protein
MSALEAAPERTKRSLKQKLRIGVALGAICLPVAAGGAAGQMSASRSERDAKKAELKVAAARNRCAKLVDGFREGGQSVVVLNELSTRNKADCGFEGVEDTDATQTHHTIADGLFTSSIHISHTITLPNAEKLRSEAAHITAANQDLGSEVHPRDILMGALMGFTVELGVVVLASMAINKRNTGYYFEVPESIQ